MRRFYLENEKGERLDLQSKTLFLHLPEGLGFGADRDYSEVEYGFFAESSNQYTQPVITGALKFLPGLQDPYETYALFVQWKKATKKMKLVYYPTKERELYMDVNMDMLILSEKTLVGILECPVKFMGTSPFYKKNPLVFIFESEPTQNAMRFDFSFPFIFSQSGAEGVQIFTPTGHFPAAIELFINGPVSKPILKIENRSTNECYGVLDLSAISIAAGDQVYYSSRPNRDGVWKISGGIKTDLIDLVNINNNNFFSVPTGEPCSASFTADVEVGYTEPIKHIMRIHEYYEG